MKDIKYIIKRVIIGVLITLILMTIKNVKAEEIGNIQAINTYNTFGSIQVKIEGLAGAADFYETPLASNTLVNYGKGFLIFSFAYYSDKNIGASGSLYSSVIHSVAVKSGNSIYNCEIGNLEPYSDSGVQWKQASAKCYVNLGSNGLERLRFQTPYQPSNNTTYIIISRYATFVGASTPQSNQNVVNAIQQQTQQQKTIISQNERIIQQQTQTNENLENINNSITNDNIDGNGSSEFFNGFDSGNNGSIFGIVNLPLQFIEKLNDTCTPVQLPRIPYINIDLTLPCVSTYYKMIPGLHEILLIVVGGFLSFLILKKFIETIQQLKDPNNDEIEVLDL